MRRFYTLGALTLALALLATSAGRPVLAQPAGGKTLVMALDQSEAKTLDPARGFEFMSFFFRRQQYVRHFDHAEGLE